MNNISLRDTGKMLFIYLCKKIPVLILKRSLEHKVILVCLNFSSSEQSISIEEYLSDYEEVTILWPARYIFFPYLPKYLYLKGPFYTDEKNVFSYLVYVLYVFYFADRNVWNQ